MSVARIIDANANRAREALRVMEEAARFLLEDEELTRSLKALRHDLVATLRPLGEVALDRDTPGDPGTRISLASEGARKTVADVTRAAGRRLGEALRAVEEYAKLLDPAVAGRVEKLRYRGYDLEQRLERGLATGERRQWGLCVILTEAAGGGRPWRELAGAVLAGAPDCVQLREKGLPDAELLARARFLVAERAPGTAIVVNDRPDVALLAGADGVHVGQDDLPCAEVRRLAGVRLLVGVSTSRLAQAKHALLDGADYCGVGPMFPSTTKHKDRIAGPAYLREYLEWDRLPHLALGGVTAGNVAELITAGARGVAVCAAVCGAGDPAGAVEAFRHALADAAATRSAS